MIVVLLSPRYTGTPPIGIKVKLYAITNQNFDTMQTHFSGEIRKHDFPAFQFDAKQRIGKRLFDDPFNALFVYHICSEKIAGISMRVKC
jgi:hypothetical protein